MRSNPVPTKTNLLGVKGCGEAGCGRRHAGRRQRHRGCAFRSTACHDIEIPTTPERVWRAIRDAKNA